MQGINWGLLPFRAVIIFYNCVEDLLRCFSAVLCQRIFYTALCFSFISTLGCSSSLLTSFTIPFLSALNYSSGKQMSVENNFFSTSFILDFALKDGRNPAQMSAAFSVVYHLECAWKRLRSIHVARHIHSSSPHNRPH